MTYIGASGEYSGGINTTFKGLKMNLELIEDKATYYHRVGTDPKFEEWADAGKEYFENWNKKLRLKCYFVIPYPLKKGTLGEYWAHWRNPHPYNDPFGEILIDVEKHTDKEDVFHTIRHEIVHAICDLRYNNGCGHGPQWIKIAKLLRVNTKRYELDLKSEKR